MIKDEKLDFTTADMEKAVAKVFIALHQVSNHPAVGVFVLQTAINHLKATHGNDIYDIEFTSKGNVTPIKSKH